MPVAIPAALAVAGAAAGAASGGKGPKTTSATSLDPQMQNMRNQAWGAAQNWANATPLGADQNTLAAAQHLQGYGASSDLANRVLQGDQAAYQQMANPYQQNVLDQLQQRWGQLQQGANSAVGGQATQAGAFGGTRQGVAQGMAQSQLGQDQMMQMASLMNQNYANTMTQAGQMANMGLGANTQQAAIGDYLRTLQQNQDPAYHKYDVLNNAIRGMPYGQTNTSQSSIPAWQAAVGGGLQGLGKGIGMTAKPGGG